MSRAMNIAETIEAVGIEALVKASKIPLRTLYRWKANDCIPGEGAAYEMRFNQFKSAVEKLQASKAPKKRKP